jgi:hypothetical protein
MLAKLIKYEFKSTMRIFLPLYGVILGFTLIRKLLDILNIEFFFSDGILVTTYLLMTIGIIALTFILGILRFYKNILGTEGYLMNTLPVKSWQLVFSKLFTSVSWFFASMLVLLSSVLIQLSSKGILGEIWNSGKLIWDSLLLEFGWQGGLLLGELVLMLIIYACYGFLMVYCAMAIGHLFNSNRVIYSFVAYIGLYFIVQMISLLTMVVYGFAFAGGLSFLERGDLGLTLLTIQLVMSGIISVAFYMVTNIIVKKRLNLE